MVGSDSAQQLLLGVAELLGVSGVDGDFGGPILDVISGCLSRPSTEKTFHPQALSDFNEGVNSSASIEFLKQPTKWSGSTMAIMYSHVTI